MIRRASFVVVIACATAMSALVGCSSAPQESTGGDEQPVLHTTDPPPGDGDYVCPRAPRLKRSACVGVIQGIAIPNSGTACQAIDLPEYNAKWYPAVVDLDIIVPRLGDPCAYPYANVISNATGNPIDVKPSAGYACALEPTRISYIAPTYPSFTLTDLGSGTSRTIPGSAMRNEVCPDGAKGCGTCIQQ